MPYIDKVLREVAFKHPMKAGELNYNITRTILAYVEMKGLSYQTINDIIGALESAKAEFQRRVVAPYETKKCLENGDVYPLS